MKKGSVHSPSSIVSYVKGQPIDYFCLVDQSGNALVKWNVKKESKQAHLKKLDELLKSDIVADGMYFLQWRAHSRAETKSIPVRKGKEVDETTLNEPDFYSAPKNVSSRPSFPSPLAEVRSFESALSDKARILELEAEVRKLTEDLAAMTEEESLDEDPAPEENTILSFLKDFGMPLLDKHFELREREIQALSGGSRSFGPGNIINTVKGVRGQTVSPAAGASSSASGGTISPGGETVSPGAAPSAGSGYYNDYEGAPRAPRPAASTTPFVFKGRVYSPAPSIAPSSYSGGGSSGGGGSAPVWDINSPEERQAPESGDNMDDEQKLSYWISNASTDELKTWITDLSTTEPADVVNNVVSLVSQLRPDLND